MAIKRNYVHHAAAKAPAADVGPQTIVTRKFSKYGWRRDLPDQRDHSYSMSGAALQSLKDVGPSCDLRGQCPPVYDQGQIGSCTANAIAGALEFDLMRQNADFMPSRLFIYYNERLMEGTVGTDSGAQIRDGVKSVASQGDCKEADWPYDDTPADPVTGVWPHGAKPALRPPQSCYDAAVKHKAVSYQSIDQNLADMKACLAEGFPFVFGFTVYESFESDAVAKSGDVPMPGAGEKVLGGHAVLAVGYDDEESKFIVRNSWGTGWGDGGYFFMPYAYLLDSNLSDDFWTIRVVS
jgi:C1A family cysteine protease